MSCYEPRVCFKSVLKARGIVSVDWRDPLNLSIAGFYRGEQFRNAWLLWIYPRQPILCSRPCTEEMWYNRPWTYGLNARPLRDLVVQ